jgi:mono/diheme cytochrome c family protein
MSGTSKYRAGALSVFLLTAFMANHMAVAQSRLPSAGECPQPRFTGKAPPEYLARSNPLSATPETLASAERLYTGKSKTLPCAICHGVRGDGKGALASQYSPPPRNFACKETVTEIADGQLFWIIQNGSPDTAMPPSKDFTDEQIWHLVLYLRNLARR